MKVLYVFIGGSEKGSSIQKKSVDLIEKLNTHIISDLLIVGEDIEKLETKHLKLNNSINRNRLFYHTRMLNSRSRLIKDFISKNISFYDYFIIRYPGADYNLYNLVKLNGNKVIWDHNSIVSSELISEIRNKTFKPKFSYILHLLEYFIFPYVMEKIFGNFIRKNAFAQITVSKDICNNYCKRRDTSKVFISSNFVPIKSISNIIDRSFSNKLRLFFINGTPNNSPWNGIERLVKSIENMNLSNVVELHIAGNTINDINYEKSFIYNHGYLNEEQLIEISSRMHIGVSTLALFKKKMNSTSAIKIGYYLNYGLPLILAYEETAFINDNSLDRYIYKVPNDSSDIDLVKVIEWYRSLNYSKSDNDIIFNWCVNNLSLEKIAYNWSEFLKGLK